MRVVPALAFLAAAGPALACSCRPPDATSPPPPYLVEARVEAVKLSQTGESAVTVLRVSRQLVGRTPKVIRVHTRTSSAACGITFNTGERQKFALARDGRRYVTNLCLMLHARP